METEKSENKWETENKESKIETGQGTEAAAFQETVVLQTTNLLSGVKETKEGTERVQAEVVMVTMSEVDQDTVMVTKTKVMEKEKGMETTTKEEEERMKVTKTGEDEDEDRESQILTEEIKTETKPSVEEMEAEILLEEEIEFPREILTLDNQSIVEQFNTSLQRELQEAENELAQEEEYFDLRPDENHPRPGRPIWMREKVQERKELLSGGWHYEPDLECTGRW
ncbi:hypothetical protein Pmani_012851 [Petrolisthes manimaculis]|uniref:Uncharacterized protein n=1 Tax=Petrolisthes manimaculis TaxID=1843537 RepID=A0AAE1PX39_9EUCA|nr:hypothetical protein Pmani_012851 [Petrolisthes manimaculis]